MEKMHSCGQALAEMASYRELPMGTHDVAVLSTRAAASAFERYVMARRQLEASLKVIVSLSGSHIV